MGSPYIGEIRMFAGNFNPSGWALCNGATMPISQNDTLFNLIGTTYGGDGQETFDLPDLQGRIPIHMGTGTSGTTYTIGEKAGVETVTLSTQQIPNHTHPLLASTVNATTGNPNNQVLASSGQVKVWSLFPPTAAMNANSITPQGGSQPHENMMPYLVINYIISLFGIFPQQT
jgi:microcystin-dependent protein